MPIQIVVNSCYGMFSISELAIKKYMERTNVKYKKSLSYCIARDDPHLVAIVKELGPLADGHLAKLRIVEIPDGTDWEIEEYDGDEWVSEVHRTWH